MKQTKKLSRGQRIFLEKEYKIDTTGVRLVADSAKSITVQLSDGSIVEYSKVGRKVYC